MSTKAYLDKDRIRAERMNKNPTQEELAERLDISDRHLRSMEKGGINIHADLLCRLSRELGTTMDELMELKEEALGVE